MQFHVFTLFPEIFETYLETSILQKARQRGLIEVSLHHIRDWAPDKHHITDDLPYGGGGGMVMKPEPIFAAIEEILGSPPRCPVILMTPQGRLFTQEVAMELAAPAMLAPLPSEGTQSADTQPPCLALLCGRYEGVDERVRAHLVTHELSIGDYVLTGGELAALVIIDAVTRLVPGVLGDPTAPWDDSHASGLLEYPHYTRPPEYRGWKVPEALLSGDHARIAQWRREQSLRRTWQRRPDLLARAPIGPADRKFIEQLEREAASAGGQELTEKGRGAEDASR